MPVMVGYTEMAVAPARGELGGDVAGDVEAGKLGGIAKLGAGVEIGGEMTEGVVA